MSMIDSYLIENILYIYFYKLRLMVYPVKS